MHSTDPFEATLRKALAERASRIHSAAPDLTGLLDHTQHPTGAHSRARVVGLSALAAAVVAAVAVVPVALSDHGAEHRRTPPAGTSTSQPPTTKSQPPTASQSRPPSPTASAPVVPPPVVNSGSSSRDCQPGQLRFAFRAGGQATQNDFGTIVIVNTSPMACLLAGAVTVTAMTAPTRPLLSAVAAPQVVHAQDIPLSANGTVPKRGVTPPTGQSWAEIVVGGFENERDGKPCAKADIITPGGWQLTGATGTTYVRNLDPAVASGSGLNPSAFACAHAGRADFLNFSVMAQP